MKTQNPTKIQVHALDNKDLHTINGGGFAYDAGRFLRAIGIYVYEGTGVRGTMMMIADYIAVQYMQ